MPAIPIDRLVEVRAAAAEHRCEGRTYLGLSRPRQVIVEVHDAVDLHGVLRDATGVPPAPGTRLMLTPVSEAEDEAEFRRAVETIADRDGTFRFSALAPGAYRVEILDEPWGIAFAAPPAPLRLAAGETKRHTLRLPQR